MQIGSGCRLAEDDDGDGHDAAAMEDEEGDVFMGDASPPEDVTRDCWAAVDGRAGGADDAAAEAAAVSVVITCTHDECTCTLISSSSSSGNDVSLLDLDITAANVTLML